MDMGFVKAKGLRLHGPERRHPLQEELFQLG
jgi:hypothetical protein